MSNDQIATILLAGLPYAWGMKAVVFTVLSVTLLMQRPQTRMAYFINSLFVSIVLTSAWVTWLLTYLTRSTTGDEIHSSQLWGLIILGNVLPWMVNSLGIAVTYYTYATAPTESSSDRDKRQDATQEVLDQTSLVLAKRGKRLSDAGINLDDRIIQLGKDRRTQDKREHDLDVREGSE